MNARYSIIIVAAAIFSAQCASPSQAPDPEGGAAGSGVAAPSESSGAIGEGNEDIDLDRSQQLRRSAVPRYINLGRVEGYGNPKTGELWIRPIAEVNDAAKGNTSKRVVAGQEQSLSVATQVGYRAFDNGTAMYPVMNDGVANSNPNDTIEFYTIQQTTGFNAFSPSTCLTKLPGGSTATLSDFSTAGVGCAQQHIGNFTTLDFAHIYLDPDTYVSGNPNHLPWGLPFTSSAANTPIGTGGRGVPSSQLGLWDFGHVGPRGSGNLKNQWQFFKNADALDFRWQGTIVGTVYEVCGDNIDDDGDGIADNNCGTTAVGGMCYTDADCMQPAVCAGKQLTKTAGMGPGNPDMKGTCSIPSWTSLYGVLSNTEVANSIAVDSQDNSYVVYVFNGNAQFGGSSVNTAGNSDGMLVSYDPLGKVRWQVQIGGTGSDGLQRVAVDKGSDTVYVLGNNNYTGTITFDPTHTQMLNQGGFLASYTSAGAYRWANALPYGQYLALTTDSAGKVYAGGSWNGSFDFQDGNGAINKSTDQAYYVRYDSDGTNPLVKSLSCATSGSQFNDLAVDSSGNVYVAGQYGGTCDFGSGTAFTVGVSINASSSRGAVASYDSGGMHRWSRAYLGSRPMPPGFSSASSIAIDAANNLVTALHFSDTTNILGTDYTTGGANNQAAALIVLNSANGNELALRTFLNGVPFSIFKVAINNNVISMSGNQNNGFANVLGSGVSKSGPIVAMYSGYDGMTTQLAYRFAETGNTSAYPNAKSLAIQSNGDILTVGDSGNWGIAFNTGSINPIGGNFTADGWIAHIKPVPITSGLVAHFNARDASSVQVTSMTNVTGWYDIGGQNNALTTTSSTFKPQYSATAINGRAGVYFSNSSVMASSAFPLSDDVTVCAVIKWSSQSQQWGTIVNHGNKDTDWALEQSGNASSANTVHFQSANDNTGADIAVVSGESYIMCGVIHNGVSTASNTRDFSANSVSGGAVTATQIVGTSATSINATSKAMYLGCSANNECSDVTIGEILYYNRALSSPELGTVKQYLQTEWGL